MKNPKRIISVRGGFELLQMVSEHDTKQCAREDIGPRGGWTAGGVPERILGIERVGL